MKIKKLVGIGSGIFLVTLFLFFSAYPQNPGSLPTVYAFTFNCLTKTPEYTMGYQYQNAEDANDECYYNLSLSILVIGYGVAGSFLIKYGLKK